ncbi:unnamed protein product [Somion occarium]|uniref:DUF6699 domain-containing protein n=1 Tax=Somion occarium TaxID=3059160 RepID=A0ABP1CT96_9APHY
MTSRQTRFAEDPLEQTSEYSRPFIFVAEPEENIPIVPLVNSPQLHLHSCLQAESYTPHSQPCEWNLATHVYPVTWSREFSQYLQVPAAEIDGVVYSSPATTPVVDKLRLKFVSFTISIEPSDAQGGWKQHLTVGDVFRTIYTQLQRDLTPAEQTYFKQEHGGSTQKLVDLLRGRTLFRGLSVIDSDDRLISLHTADV